MHCVFKDSVTESIPSQTEVCHLTVGVERLGSTGFGLTAAMAMLRGWSKGLLALTLCGLGLAAVVNASIGDTLLRTPLFEVGTLWVNATQNIANRIHDTIFQVPDFNSASTYLGLGVGSVVLYYLYQLLCVPMNRVRMLGDLGYIPEGTLTQKDMANLVRKRRKVGNIPPPFPNGWFSVLESRDLKRCDVRAVSVLGESFHFFFLRGFFP